MPVSTRPPTVGNVRSLYSTESTTATEVAPFSRMTEAGLSAVPETLFALTVVFSSPLFSTGVLTTLTRVRSPVTVLSTACGSWTPWSFTVNS